MKKFILMTALAILAICSCNKTEKEDSVSISPVSKAFSAEGGSVDVTVKSSGEWFLDGTCSWATPSKVTGNNGDVVTFTVNPNETYEALNATYTFMVNDKTATFEITVAAHDLPTFTLSSEEEVRMNCKEGFFNVELDTDLTFKDITCSIEDEAKSWLKYYSVEGTVLTFQVLENPDFAVRTGDITLSAEMCDNIVISVSQNAKSKIVLDAEKYECTGEASQITITVTEANVDYTVEVPEDYKNWISVASNENNVITLNISASDDSRDGHVNFVATDGTLTIEAPVAQVAAAKAAKVTVLTAAKDTWVRYSAADPYWTTDVTNYTSKDWSWWSPENNKGWTLFCFIDDYEDSKYKGGVGMTIIVDMQAVTKIDGLNLRYHESRGDTKLKLSVSNDNTEWIELGEFGDGTNNVQNRYFEFENLECRYFKYETLGVNNESIGCYVHKLFFYHN